jgi:hypothetical protein
MAFMSQERKAIKKTNHDYFLEALAEWRECVTPSDLTHLKDLSWHQFMQICHRAVALKNEEFKRRSDAAKKSWITRRRNAKKEREL